MDCSNIKKIKKRTQESSCFNANFHARLGVFQFSRWIPLIKVQLGTNELKVRALEKLAAKLRAKARRRADTLPSNGAHKKKSSTQNHEKKLI